MPYKKAHALEKRFGKILIMQVSLTFKPKKDMESNNILEKVLETPSEISILKNTKN